jgi:NB-ARC domain-containing protein
MNNWQESSSTVAPQVTSEITGQVAVGRFVLQVGDASGAVVREASRSERAHLHPRPTPILVRPRLIRRLLDRRMEVAAALSALDAGLPIELSGEAGIGKTAILRHLAHHPRATSFVDGIVYVRARHQPLPDLLQLIFEAFYESDEISKPVDAEIRRGLREKQALILLDDVHLTQNELEQVLDIAPQSAFAVATRERCLWGEVRSLALKGLSFEDAVLLLERELERSLDGTERSAAASLCAALGGHPVRVLQAAALIRDHGIPVEECARSITPATLMAELMASIDEKQRRALLTLTALPGVPLTAQHVSGIAELTDIEPALRTLVRRGLVGGSQSRHRLADGVADQLRRTEDLKPWVNRAITYFTAWAERYRRSPDRLLEEAEALMAVQHGAADARRWGEVLRVGRLLEGALVIGARWGAWAISLERCLTAAKALGDRSAEAWALHQIGTRAVCVGDQGLARTTLTRAVALHESMGDTVAAASSRQNLSLVLAPASDDSHATMPFAEVTDLEPIALRGEIWSAPHVPAKGGVGTALLTALQMVLAAGLAFFATIAALTWGSWDVARIGAFLRGGVEPSQVVDSAAPQPVQAADLHAPPSPAAHDSHDSPTPPMPRAAGPDRARILIFTPRPGSIASDGPTRLCYAVSGAVQARVEPGVGEVPATSTLTCVRVAPVRTTTYELDAYGRDGYPVRQQLVIVVR